MTAPPPKRPIPPVDLHPRVRRFIAARPFGASARELGRDFGKDGLLAVNIADSLVSEGVCVRQGTAANPTYRLITKRDETDPPRSIPAPKEPPMNARVSSPTMADDIAAFLYANGSASLAEVQANVEGSPDSVRVQIGKMARAGLVMKEGEGKGAVYSLPESEQAQVTRPGTASPTPAPDEALAALRKRLDEADRENDALEQDRDGWKRVAEVNAAERDQAQRALDAARQEIAAALPLLDAGRVWVTPHGQRVEEPTTLVDRARNVAASLAAETAGHREARAKLDFLREEQRQDHAEFDAIDAALGFGEGSTRSGGDRVGRIHARRVLLDEARTGRADAEAEVGAAWKALGFHPSALPSRTLAEQCERARELADEASVMGAPDGLPPSAVSALVDLTEHLPDEAAYEALRKFVRALGVASP